MTDRTHLSIGEVLSLLQDEFPDVTISKIRFLESQGLLDPERTPSGYRKFSQDDIDQLRWILRQQREHFLPLKVIKQRLADGELDDGPVPEPGAGRGASANLLQEAPVQPEAAAPDPDDGPRALTVDDLVDATGLTSRQIGELERFGLLTAEPVAGTATYDDDALDVARLAAAFLAHGVEPRHLRMYKVAAEREAGVFEQLAMPAARRRSAEARRQAAELVDELAGLGGSLRDALLRRLLREALGR